MIDLYPNAPKKQRQIKKRKKELYNYKKNSTVILFFPRLTEFTNHSKSAINNTLVDMQCQQATTIICWIAKQNRYYILKGYATDYQLDMYEMIVEERYLKHLKSAYLDKLKPYAILDVSSVPPAANYTTDKI